MRIHYALQPTRPNSRTVLASSRFTVRASPFVVDLKSNSYPLRRAEFSFHSIEGNRARCLYSRAFPFDREARETGVTLFSQQLKASSTHPILDAVERDEWFVTIAAKVALFTSEF